MKGDSEKTKAELLAEIAALRRQVADDSARSLLDFSPQPHLSLNAEGRIVAVNGAWLEMVGSQRENACGQFLEYFLLSEERSRLRVLLNELLATGSARDQRFVLAGSLGQEVVVRSDWKVASVDGGEPLLHCLMLDVTRQEELERRAQFHGERSGALFQASMDGILFCDLTGSILESNSALSRLTGFAAKELIGRNIKDITPDRWHEQAEQIALRKVVREGWCQPYDKELYHSSGHIISVTVRKWLVRDDAGNPLGYLTLVRDKSQAVMIREAIRSRDNQYKRFVETANEGIIGLDAGFRITYINDIMSNMLGYSKLELLGTPMDALIFDDGGACTALDELPDGQAARLECRFRHRDGSAVWGLVSISPLLSDDGRYLGAFAMVVDITERKLAEERLLLTQFSVDKAPMSIYWLNEQGEMVYVNEATCTIHGFTREEMRSMTIMDINPDLDVTEWKAHWEMRKAKVLTRFESRHLRKDGSVFPVSLTSHYKNYDGCEYLFAFCYDITEQLQSGERLRRNRELLSAVERMSRTGGWEYDMFSKQMTFTDGIFGLLKLGKDESETMPLETFKEFFTPEEYFNSMAAFKKAIRLGKPVEFETTLTTRDGQELMLRSKAHPDLDENGEVVRVFGSSLDVTREKKAALELKQAHSRMLSILDGIDADIYVSDFKTDEILFVNAHMRKFYDNPRTGKLCYREFLGAKRKCLRCPKPELLTTGATARRTMVSEWYNRKLKRWFLNHDRAIPWLEGRMAHMHMAADITDLKNMQRDLRRAMRDAKSASVAKNEFLANMSHEIRTPLNGLLGMLQVLNMSKLDEEQKEHLKTAIVSGRNLMGILNDILDLSKVESGKMELEEQEAELGEIVNSVASVFRGQAGACGLRIETLVADDGKSYLLDKGRLRQILFNLVGNGVKFTDEGGVTIEAHPLPHRTRGGKRILYFSVTDSGIGIPDHKVAEAFDPFTQVDGSYTRKYQGTGLGLGIVRRLVRLMGGTIAVSSQSGQGTSIIFTVAARECVRRKAVDEFKPVEMEVKALRILVVEDEQVNRLVARRLLCRLGHEVECVPTGEDALRVLPESEFDCILMDIQMPGMDGMETTGVIRNELKLDLPIIALTAHVMKGDKCRFLDAGMNGYVSKPFDLASIQAELERLTCGCESSN